MSISRKHIIEIKQEETRAMKMKKAAIVTFLVAASVLAFTVFAAASAVWGS
jgi:predicted benzoate:H+ symporter BenE